MKTLIGVIVVVLLLVATACGSHPDYYGECHVYVGDGRDYRATIDLYGSSSSTSYEGRIRLADACKAVRGAE